MGAAAADAVVGDLCARTTLLPAQCAHERLLLPPPCVAHARARCPCGLPQGGVGRRDPAAGAAQLSAGHQPGSRARWDALRCRGAHELPGGVAGCIRRAVCSRCVHARCVLPAHGDHVPRRRCLCARRHGLQLWRRLPRIRPRCAATPAMDGLVHRRLQREENVFRHVQVRTQKGLSARGGRRARATSSQRWRRAAPGRKASWYTRCCGHGHARRACNVERVRRAGASIIGVGGNPRRWRPRGAGRRGAGRARWMCPRGPGVDSASGPGAPRGRCHHLRAPQAMNKAGLLGAVLGSLSACAATAPVSPCPQGFAPDPQRHARIERIVRSSVERAPDGAPTQMPGGLCFGPSRSLGVLAGGRPLLDAHASDDALAARLVHLAVHARDGLGDGCAAGLAAARASEQRATRVEAALRLRLGLPVLPVDDASVEADYAARCKSP